MDLVPTLALLSGCTTTDVPEQALGVRDLISNADQFEGQRVAVVGYLPYCEPLGCPLAEGKGSADAEFRLGIGSGIDNQLRKYVGRKIVIEATFNGECVDEPDDDVITICTDRATSLERPKLLGAAPSNFHSKGN